jgi:N-acetylneuraminic acid mutarotase
MNKIVLPLLILILLVSSLIAVKPASSLKDEPEKIVENTWTEKAPMHQARADLGAAVVNGKIYAVGGRIQTYQDQYRTESNEVSTNEEYDPATNTWTYKAPMPTPSSGFAIAVFQNKIYCIGGGVTQFFNASKASWDVKLEVGFNLVYDPATNTWEKKTPMPTPRVMASASVVNGKIYVFGGYPNRTLNEVY